MLSESLHPNRIAARSFIRPSRFGFQIGLRLCPLPNSAITGRAGDNGFIQRNGWFGRHCRQTVKLSDFVSHPKKSTIPVLTDLGPHRPEVEKAQRAAPAGCRLLTFPHGTSGKGWHIHALSQRRFSMTQAVTYERETKSVAFQGKIIVLESLTPVLPPKEKEQRKKEIERCLYEVFSKYGDRFP